MQLQTLAGVAKGGLFLKKPDSPDVRDRAYTYWRLLSTDPSAAQVHDVYAIQLMNVCDLRVVVIADRPPISIP